MSYFTRADFVLSFNLISAYFLLQQREKSRVLSAISWVKVTIKFKENGKKSKNLSDTKP